MTPQGPHPFGGGPDDPDGGGGEDRAPSEPPDDGTEVGPDDEALKGWLPPDDRLWRHPSEAPTAPTAPAVAGVGRGRGAGSVHPAAVPVGAGRHRRRNVATALVGSGAAAAVVVGILLLLAAGSGPGPGQPATTGSSAPTALTEVTGCCKAVPVAAQGAQRALVSLQVATDHGVTQDCGVAVAAGGLVATTLDAVADARSVTALTASGRREPATVVATDRSSDVALVRVSTGLPVARFADDTAVTAGRPAIVMAMAARSGQGASTTTMWADGTIRSVGTAVTRGTASGMAGIDATARSMPTMAGEILLEPDGRVLGILDTTGSPSGDRGSKVFLPAQLVVGVARTLAASGRVEHGWLGVEGHDAPTGSPPTTTSSTASSSSAPASTTVATVGRVTGGAEIVKVDPDGASANVLRPGDVILGVDGAPVRSMAELRSRLYVLGPGTQVELVISRGGIAMTVAVDLSTSP